MSLRDRDPEDPEEDTTKKFLEGCTKEASADIEELYTFGKISERGTARFKTEEGLCTWQARHYANVVFYQVLCVRPSCALHWQPKQTLDHLW